MHDRKCWTGCIGTASQSGDETLCKGSFATAKLAFESEYTTGVEIVRKLLSDGFRLSGAAGNECNQEATFAFCFSIFYLASQFESAIVSGISGATFAPSESRGVGKSRRATRSP